MPITALTDRLHIVPGLVNTYILKSSDGLVLIDTGFARSVRAILAGLAAIGAQPRDVNHILITHAHPDHIGGAAALQARTGAVLHAHAADIPIVESGGPFRPIRAAPGVRNAIVAGLLGRLSGRVVPVPVDRVVQDGVPLVFDSDIVPVHIPGHSAGQVAYLWKHAGGVLFAADACINRRRMVLAAAQEDVAEARRSLAKLAALEFQIACFGHGKPILRDADQRFRQAWL